MWLLGWQAVGLQDSVHLVKVEFSSGASFEYCVEYPSNSVYQVGASLASGMLLMLKLLW